MSLHIIRNIRDQYQLADLAFAPTGDLPLTDVREAYALTQRLNHDLAIEEKLLPMQIYALSVIDDCAREMLAQYERDVQPDLWQSLMINARNELGEARFSRFLVEVTENFPPMSVYRDEMTAESYLQTALSNELHRTNALQTALLVWYHNQNRATLKYRRLFDDAVFQQHDDTLYQQFINTSRKFYSGQPDTPSQTKNILEMLVAPLTQSPEDILGQLEYIAIHWQNSMGRERLMGMVSQVRSAITYLRDENLWLQNEQTALHNAMNNAAMGGGVVEPPQFDASLAAEPEQFTPDRDWMPQLVMIAKNSYVWLDQLSRQYQRAISRLDEIPDETLDQLQAWGITGLWLIGLWERSKASRTIKQWMGNQDAVASAYSLHDYRIAEDLGGPTACADLRERCAKRGIRLASDMVPNHMGIDSAWVSDHPEWFLGVSQPPYPNYTFRGENLSSDERIRVFIEDHYWSHSDAAVVFKLDDMRTGEVRYIYHGNDGTSTPWNDTAQLNYLDPVVREVVIQTILNVARQFSVIRFDAAMTLAKRHIQRLWFPQPGQTGYIPSRQAFAMSADEFNTAIPIEFWREVVDRCAAEVPDTLLLAEAFWMLEGYFVRTLGMHRVYNSSFMHMLRDEKNAGYRAVIKDTISFDPQILRRYVNFMNNPDEKTAVEQFGRGEKYFGICVMMATLPGLPMFGHGQFEGFSEKYGMEFRRALWEEQVDEGLREHHERVIVPLLKRRYLFADVENFVLFDVQSQEAEINENVFAYTNRVLNKDNHVEEKALVLYNNRLEPAEGWVRLETEIKPQFNSDEDTLDERMANWKAGKRRTITEALTLSEKEDVYSIFRDQMSGQEFIRSNRDMRDRGLYIEMGGYKCHVFLDWREVVDNDDSYARVAEFLKGNGTDNVEILRMENEKLRDEANESANRIPPIPVVIHSTHEAGIKIGGIGAVLDGLLSAPSYVKGVARTILVGPLHTHNNTEMERLFSQKQGLNYFYYFADRGLNSCTPELAWRLSEIEREWSVRICYGRRRFSAGEYSAEHEVLLVDAQDLPRQRLNDFKFGVWERFGLDVSRYQTNPEFDEYMALALPQLMAVRAIVDLGGVKTQGEGETQPLEKPQTAPPNDQPATRVAPPLIVCHEFMGLPLWYAAELSSPGEFASAYVAHEVATARVLVEGDAGHDVRFYNVMRQAMRHGLTMDQVLEDYSGYFKHPMTKTAAQCNYVLAVSDITADELRFLDWRFRNRKINTVYNGVPSQRISLDEKLAANIKLKSAAHALVGFTPTWVFTHVTRLAQSKAIWRDMAVMRHLDYLLAQRGESAVFIVVASAIPQGRPTDDARRMHHSYGWPRNHYTGTPDLVDGEISIWHSMMTFNDYARASRSVLVNQFGFSHERLGGAIPAGIEFNDLRRGTDVEFGQSIYEPFGIAQIEPLTYGALCVVSDICGCAALGHSSHVKQHEAQKTLIIANYTHLPYLVDLRSAQHIAQYQRDDLEARAAWEVANEIVNRLPRSDDARKALLDSGYALANASSWEVVAKKMFLPAVRGAE